MTIARIAHRYANAMYEAAREANKLDQLIADIHIIDQALSASRDLLLFFKSPILSSDIKSKIFEDIFQGKIDEYTINVLRFLLKLHREKIIKEIIHEFYIIQRKEENIQLARVTSAVDLTDSQKEKLNGVLSAVSRKRVEVGYVIDTSIRGGLVVRIEDTVYDGSIKRQLERIHKRFIEGVAA